MKSYLPKRPSVNEREWVVVDAQNKVLGRLAAGIIRFLRGKNRVDFAPQVDNGSFVVVVNAGKVKLTGDKEDKKLYQFYSGYRSGLKRVSAGALRERHPDRLLRLAVKRMLPRTRIGRRMYGRLKVYAGPAHPHLSQKPRSVEFERA